jgi:hypothetical protein
MGATRQERVPCRTKNTGGNWVAEALGKQRQQSVKKSPYSVSSYALSQSRCDHELPDQGCCTLQEEVTEECVEWWNADCHGKIRGTEEKNLLHYHFVHKPNVKTPGIKPGPLW